MSSVVPVTLPHLSMSMEEATVLKWLVAEGAVVKAGEPIVEIETDKATVQVEAPASGLLRRVAQVGDIILIDGLLAEIQSAPVAAAGGPSSRPRPPHGAVPRRAVEETLITESPAAQTLPGPSLPVAVDDAIPGDRPHDLTGDELIEIYRTMVRIRAFEEQVIDAYNARLVPGSTHPCIGQEGSKVGAIAALGPDDLVLATYRGHGEAIALGLDPVEIMAELMARATGVCKGKGGSMHLSDPARGLVMTNAIVAAHIPIAGGVAMSCKHRRTGQVVLCFFGDGAACEGEFFETLNMAQLWQVPLVFVCENNGWAISVPTSASHATPDIADRARGFGMPASVVDGNDVIAVRAAVAAAVDRARAGGGPSLVECKTVRWERHSALSAGGDQEEGRRAWQRVDPIRRFQSSLMAWGEADESALAAIDDTSSQEAAEARALAESAPFPTAESVFDDVFAPAAGPR
jgi:TPP-dependent pyruvate/acetoin dehydrogenase alpha subunit